MDIRNPNILVVETAKQFSKQQQPYAVCGGLALAVYGAPRETKDVDHVIPNQCLSDVKNTIQQHFSNTFLGFQNTKFGGLIISRITVLGDEPLQEDQFNTIDLVTPRDDAYTERLLNRALSGELRNQTITVVAPEDFVILKILSTRDYDLEDIIRIQRVMKLNDGLIENELLTLSKHISDHPIMDRWQQVCASK